jgi:uncharacterized protein YoxC
MPGTEIKYLKRGTIGKTGNELLLTDENKKSYRVDEAVAAVWNMCDGIRTVNDITDELSKHSETGKPEIKEAVLKAMAQLERFGLLERK